jgi:hypothetical protein
MRLLDWFRPPSPADWTLAPQIEAWTDNSHFYDVVVDDIFGAATQTLTRAAAMRVPAMARARNLTCGTIAALPLTAMRAAAPAVPQPYWAFGTDGQLGTLTTDQLRAWGILTQTPWHRLLWTIDANPLPAANLVWIPGPNEGVLGFGAGSLRMAYDLERNARDVAMRPLRLELHQTSAAEMTKEERQEAVAAVRDALATNDGVLFTNNAVELVEHRVDSDALQLGARNASSLDVARLANMPAMMLDATAQGASLEYQTMTGRNQQWLDYGLALYMDSVEARLSMDDVVPAGQRVAFDTTDWTSPDASDTGPALED